MYPASRCISGSCVNGNATRTGSDKQSNFLAQAVRESHLHGCSLACTGPKLGPACGRLSSVHVHVCLCFLGRFSIKDVVPSKEGESSKIKVRVRLDIHGVLNVVNASLVEKLAVAPEPEMESMEVEGQDEKAEETTGDAASEVQVQVVLKLLTQGFHYTCFQCSMHTCTCRRHLSTIFQHAISRHAM